MAGFWGSVASLLFVYYNLFLSPHALACSNPPKSC